MRGILFSLAVFFVFLLMLTQTCVAGSSEFLNSTWKEISGHWYNINGTHVADIGQSTINGYPIIDKGFTSKYHTFFWTVDLPYATVNTNLQ